MTQDEFRQKIKREGKLRLSTLKKLIELSDRAKFESYLTLETMTGEKWTSLSTEQEAKQMIESIKDYLNE